MKRNEFFKAAAAFAVSPIFAGKMLGQSPNLQASDIHAKKFAMKFAPRTSMPIFKASSGKNVFEQMRYFAANGFTAVEGVATQNTDVNTQKNIGALSAELGLHLGAISAMNDKSCPSMTANVVPAKKGQKNLTGEDNFRKYLDIELQKVEVCLKNIGSQYFIIGPGLNAEGVDFERQYECALKNMQYCAQYCKGAGITMLIEPLNLKTHPNQFCSTAAIGARFVKDVAIKNCQLLFDTFHEQMQIGNMESLDELWGTIGYFHVADTPNRTEPGSGSMDYDKFFSKIWKKGYRGFIGLEYIQSAQTKEVDASIIKQLRAYDALAI